MPTLSFDEIARKTKRKTETVFHEFTQDLAEQIIDNTRPPHVNVVTGFLLGSWFASINDASGPKGEEDKQGDKTFAEMSVNISQAKVGDFIVIGNNANYAPHVENGTQRMAGRHMVKKSVRNANQILQRTAARISKT